MDSFEYIKKICSFPHRGSGTRYEHEACGIISRELTSMGYKVNVQEFKSPPDTLYAIPLEVGIPLVVLGYLSLNVYSTATYLILFVFCLLLFLPLIVETSGLAIETNILPKRVSYNIFTLPDTKASKNVIVSAHYDTQRGSFLFHPSFVDHLETFYHINYIGFGLVPAGILIRIFMPVVRWPLIMGLVISFIGLVVFFAAWVTGKYTPGANDNGTGVGLALYLAEDYIKNKADYPGNVNLMFLFTGCEEVGERGMRAFIKRYKGQLDKENTSFIILDNLGTGKITYLEGEGMLAYKRAGGNLLKIAEDMKVKYHDIQKQHNLLLPTDSLPAMAYGYSSISFLGKDEKGRLGNYHWHTDTIENLDRDLLQMEEKFFKEYIIKVME